MSIYSPTLYYNASQIATIVLDVESIDGYAIDPINPIVAGVFDPNLISLDGFPVAMTRLGSEIGSFICRFQLPGGIGALGTYLAIVKWVDAETSYQHHRTYSIIIGANSGSGSAVGL